MKELIVTLIIIFALFDGPANAQDKPPEPPKPATPDQISMQMMEGEIRNYRSQLAQCAAIAQKLTAEKAELEKQVGELKPKTDPKP